RRTGHGPERSSRRRGHHEINERANSCLGRSGGVWVGSALLAPSPWLLTEQANQPSPTNRLFLMTPCTPQLPSTTCVMPKSAATEMSEIASSSLRPWVVIKKWRIFRKASRSARSTDDLE